MSKIEVNTVDSQCGSTITVGSSGKNVKIEGNDIRSNDYKAADGGNLINQCGTTITLGASGDTINLASGASQSGFGRTGTVNWNTTPVTSTPTTGVNGVGYFIDASGGAKTINLPASPTAGDIMAVSDYAQVSTTNSITIGRNGSNIQGDASDLVIQRNGAAFTLVFVDATKGWIVTDTGVEADKSPEPEFICASSPCVATVGDYKVHTFTGPGTFTVNSVGNAFGSNQVDYLVIGGGGGGGSACAAGGGGAGGYRESHNDCVSGPYTASPLATATSITVSAQGYPITVGGGGPGASESATSSPGTIGTNSSALGITSAGGGLGGGNPNEGGNGGSGGGGSHYQGPGGTGNTPPVSPAQGTNGGTSNPAPVGDDAGGGGGGAIEAGNTDGSGHGGDGTTSSINNSAVARGGGGAGGSRNAPGSLPNGGPFPGGTGGGGDGGGGSSYPRPSAEARGDNGTSNTGGGGGGGTRTTPNVPSPNPNGAGGNGGSGIVIIRYKFQ